MRHFQREIDKLKKKTLSLSTVVEESVQLAVKSIEKRDVKLARKVIESGEDIDRLEVDIEEECLKILALYQPVALDLRYIVSVFKINNDLERIGDLSENIAERAIFLAYQKKIDIPFDFPGMTEITISMLKMSLDALINMDTHLSEQVCMSDDKVDNINRLMYKQIQQSIRKNPDDLESYIHLLGVSRLLERIADHATNIAEDVLYMCKGEIVRHRVKDSILKRRQ
jgi:phosphate transport system protein